MDQAEPGDEQSKLHLQTGALGLQRKLDADYLSFPDYLVRFATVRASTPLPSVHGTAQRRRQDLVFFDTIPLALECSSLRGVFFNT